MYLNTFNDRIEYATSIFEIINIFMQFIYTTLEYNIFHIVNIMLDIYDSNPYWKFGTNVIKTLEECRQKYYRKSQDYLYVDILNEIESRLNIRYSTSDVIRAIEYLAMSSKDNKAYFEELKNKYIY